MVDVQAENGHIRIANALYDEILKRDFSKRQLNIVLFIMRYSWGCGHKACQLKMVDFEQAGVNKTHIKQELDRLVQAKIILWNREFNVFQINKDYDQWVISYQAFFRQEKTEELLKRELTSYQNSNHGYQKGNSQVTKMVTEGLLKKELSESGNPDPEQENNPPITKGKQEDINTPLPPNELGEFGKKPSRYYGTNPRAKGMNPRAEEEKQAEIDRMVRLLSDTTSHHCDKNAAIAFITGIPRQKLSESVLKMLVEIQYLYNFSPQTCWVIEEFERLRSEGNQEISKLWKQVGEVIEQAKEVIRCKIG